MSAKHQEASSARPADWALWRVSHPVWMCAMRPFFLLAMFSSSLLLAWWAGALQHGWPLPAVAGGAVVWHAHELLYGFALAAVAGFALTAVPEFADWTGQRPRQLQALVLLWLLARLGFWGTVWWPQAGLWLAAVAGLGFLAYLLWLLAPPLYSAKGRRHSSFAWAVLALGVTLAGFYADLLTGGAGLRWLHASLGVLMVLVVVSASRISMEVVNSALDEVDPEADSYLARPPRRHLATLCISLYTLAEWWQSGTALTGWLAWAAAAALLNLLNDWHPAASVLWRRRWPRLLYAMYWCMALGYAALGAAALGLWPLGWSAGRHALTIGVVGLATLVVIGIAGRAHAGLQPDAGPWLASAGALLLAAVAARAAVGLLAGPWLAVAAGLWCVGYGLLWWRIAPGLWRARTDGQTGCAGPL